MAEFVQASFSGGINLLGGTKMADDQYTYLINGRPRTSSVRPINMPLELIDAPSGKKQGIYALGDILVLFVAGKAYYKTANSTTWTLIADFQLSSTEPYIYACAVPVSLMNSSRKARNDDDNTEGVNKAGQISVLLSPTGLVCQDGKAQPWIIFNNGTARILQTYAQWNPDIATQEYVPIGTCMAYLGSCLYIAGRDIDSGTNRNTVLYRSVSGRPLDFVVAIQETGAKVVDADSMTANVPHKVSFEEITCLKTLGTDKTSLFVGTRYGGYIVQPRVDANGALVDTVYGEPTFKNIPFLDSGCVGQFGIADINQGESKDTAFVDFEGIKCFNAVRQLLLEDNSEEFSSIISPEFFGVKQDITCATNFGGNTLFAVKTLNFGYCIVVYDNNLQKFVSFDINITSPIKQFAVTANEILKKLYCITDDKVYQIYGDISTPAPCTIKSKEWCSNIPKIEIRPSYFRPVFDLPRITGDVTVIPYYDLKQGQRKSQEVTYVAGGVDFPVQPPVGPYNKDRVENITFDVSAKSKSCWKCSFVTTWANGADLTHYMLGTSEESQHSTLQQQSKIS